MGAAEDPFEPLHAESTAEEFSVLSNKPLSTRPQPLTPSIEAATARLQGFGLDDHPIVSGLQALPGEVVAARTTVPLRREMIGSEVVVLYDGGDHQRPIIIGVIQSPQVAPAPASSPTRHISIDADDDRFVISAEREIVLRCGDSSITLTRAGKVIIKGNYILSRSTGYNKIKGAAIDIN